MSNVIMERNRKGNNRYIYTETNEIDVTKIIELLINYGLNVDMEVVEIVLEHGFVIPVDLELDIKYGIDLLDLCYKYDTFPKKYVEKFRANPELHYGIREMIQKKKQAMNDTTPKIIEEIKKIGYADRFMYTDAVVVGRSELVEFLEKEYGCEPNMETCMKIKDMYEMRRYYARVLSHARANGYEPNHRFMQTGSKTKEPHKVEQPVKTEELGDDVPEKIIVKGKCAKQARIIVKKID